MLSDPTKPARLSVIMLIVIMRFHDNSAVIQRSDNAVNYANISAPSKSRPRLIKPVARTFNIVMFLES